MRPRQGTIAAVACVVLVVFLGVLYNDNNHQRHPAPPSQVLHSSSISTTTTTIPHHHEEEDPAPLPIKHYEIQVPENRNDPHSRNITIGYTIISSFSSKNESSSSGSSSSSTTITNKTPIFLIGGGPGSSINQQLDSRSATKRGRVLQKLNVLRQVGDVYIVDLRGTYLSHPRLHCTGLPWWWRYNPKHSFFFFFFSWHRKSPQTLQDYYQLQIDASRYCRQRLLQQGFDLRGYNVLHAAQDILDVAAAHAVAHFHVAGTSFGSFLSLTLARYYSPDRVQRVFATGIEGFDLSIDDVEWVGRAMEEIASQAATVWDNRHGFSNSLLAYRSLMAKSSQAVQDGVSDCGLFCRLGRLRRDDTSIPPFEFQLHVMGGPGYHLNRRDHMLDWPRQVDRYLSGDLTDFVNSNRNHWKNAITGYSIATEGLFDCSSWVSANREEHLRGQEHDFLLTDYQEMVAFCEGWKVERLSDDFRIPTQPISAEILLVQGTLDTATPVQNARATIAQFPNGHLVEVENGSHDVFLEVLKYHPDFADTIVSFLRDGTKPAMDRMVIPPIEFHNITTPRD